MRREIALAAALAAGPAFAQVFGNWSEGPIPETPALRTQSLVPIDVEGSGLRFGIDPESLTVGQDGVVRYVFVGTSPAGAVNASYVGLNCLRAEFRLYARHSPSQGWRPVEADWKAMKEGVDGRHAYLVAKQGACAGSVPGGNAKQIVQALKTPDRKNGF